MSSTTIQAVDIVSSHYILNYIFQIANQNLLKLAKGIWIKKTHEANVPIKFEDNTSTSATHRYTSYDFNSNTCTRLREDMDINIGKQFTEGAGIRYAAHMRLVSIQTYIDEVLAAMNPPLRASGLFSGC
jgi:hypothetical protein